ncbi:MAG: nucleotidyltransferase domain-containing protein [Nanoarchaeota archaeon]|nr:nucleotidyltransferase domain-containing protein [Nanoarchaeota archaeon]
MNKIEIIAYTTSFVSFVLKDLNNLVKEIILFGSVARREFDKKSDIDLFFDVNKEEIKKVENIVKKSLSKFYKSKIHEIWKLKGITKNISIKVGVLDEWKLKRSIISDGIILYGKYKESPKNIKHYLLINHKPIKDITKRNRIIRKIIGRKEKDYNKKGLLEDIEGKIISKRTIIVPIGKSKELIDIFNKEKIDYRMFEIWSDQF